MRITKENFIEEGDTQRVDFLMAGEEYRSYQRQKKKSIICRLLWGGEE